MLTTNIYSYLTYNNEVKVRKYGNKNVANFIEGGAYFLQ